MDDTRTPQEAYIEGRLNGLNELIGILQDAIQANNTMETSVLVKSIVEHIAAETDSILTEMQKRHGEEHPVLKKAERIQQIMEKAAEMKKPEAAPEVLKKNVEIADGLMKNLMELQQQ